VAALSLTRLGFSNKGKWRRVVAGGEQAGQADKESTGPETKMFYFARVLGVNRVRWMWSKLENV
jgi:hypothetical protein